LNDKPGEDMDNGKNGVGAEPGSKKRSRTVDHVSRALRSVYDDTLREDIPQELRDLLGKLD